MIIAHFGIKTCFAVDGCTYLLSCLPWLWVKKSESLSKKEPISWMVGFHSILHSAQIRSLTISRLLNNCSYASATTIIPLVIAFIAKGNNEFFIYHQGIANSVISVGFIGASILGTRMAKDKNRIKFMICGSSFISFLSFILLISTFLWIYALYLSALFLGIGTFCFRVSGMTLGQAFTPTKVLGPVIIAGDTIVRFWSFLISTGMILFFEWGQRELDLLPFCLMILLLPSFALLAPLWAFQLAKQYAEKSASGPNS